MGTVALVLHPSTRAAPPVLMEEEEEWEEEEEEDDLEGRSEDAMAARVFAGVIAEVRLVVFWVWGV